MPKLKDRILNVARTDSCVRRPVHVWFEMLSVQFSHCPGLHISQLFQSSKRGHLSQRPCHTLVPLCPKSLGLPDLHFLVPVPSPHCPGHMSPTLPQTQWSRGFGMPYFTRATTLKVVPPPLVCDPFSVSVPRAVTGSSRLSRGELYGGLAVPKVLCRRLLCSAGVSCSCVDGTCGCRFGTNTFQIFLSCANDLRQGVSI